MEGLVYDAGALIAAERGSRDVWALHVEALQLGITPRVPAAVFAQAWRGGARQAQLARFLKGCELVPLDAARATAVGLLLGASGTDDVADASVVELAAAGDVVVTADPYDLEAIADAVGLELVIHEL